MLLGTRNAFLIGATLQAKDVYESITAFFSENAAIFYALVHTNWNGFLLRRKEDTCIQLTEA